MKLKTKTMQSKIKILLLMVVCILIPTLMYVGVLPSSNYIMLLLSFICLYSIITSGLDLLFGYSGQVSLGHAGFFAIGAYVSALLSLTRGDFGLISWFGFSLPPFWSMLIGAAFAMGIGILLALPSCRLVYHFLTLFTMAFGQLINLLCATATKVTNGYSGLISIPKMSLFGYRLNNNYKFYLFAFAILVIVLIAKHHIINSRVGRAFIAIRDNPQAANGCGIDVTKYKVTAFALSAFCAGLGGGMYAHLITFISPETFVYAQSVAFMTMLLLGGNGSFAGPILGAAIITILQESVQALADYQKLIYGILLLVAVLFLPRGFNGLIVDLKTRISHRSKKKIVKEEGASA